MVQNDQGNAREVREFTWTAMVPVATDGSTTHASLAAAFQAYVAGGSVAVWDEGVSFIFPVTGEGEDSARRYARMLVASVLFDAGLTRETSDILDHKMDLVRRS